MFSTILIGILLLIAVGLFFAARSAKQSIKEAASRPPERDRYGDLIVDRSDDIPSGMPKIFQGVGIVAVLLATIIAGFSATYTQDPGEALVIRSFTGEVVGKDTEPGLGFKAPWEDIVQYNVRNQTVIYSGDGTFEGENGPAITAQDKDGATASINIVVRYSIDPEKVIEIYNEYGQQADFESKMVHNDVRSVVRNIPLKYSTTTFRLNREQAALEMQAALEKKWEGQGVLVESVDLRDISYPESIEESLQRVQEATNEANRAKAELETAKVEAEKTRVEAQAQADYDQIVRCGATVTTEETEINGAPTTVTKVVPNTGDACQNRLNDQVLMNKYIEALKEMADNGNLIVVPQGFGGILNLPSSSSTED